MLPMNQVKAKTLRKIQGPLDTDVRYLPVMKTQWSIRYTVTENNCKHSIEIDMDHEPAAVEIDLISLALFDTVNSVNSINTICKTNQDPNPNNSQKKPLWDYLWVEANTKK